MHSMLSEVQPQASAVSAVQVLASVYVVQGSAGVVPHPHGAQAVFAGQAGQPQTDTDADPPPVFSGGDEVAVADVGTVIVVVAPFVHEQLHAGQAAPAGHSGQLQVQVPGPPPVPDEPPVPVLVVHPPPPPPPPSPH
jgi:hypothetical protein